MDDLVLLAIPRHLLARVLADLHTGGTHPDIQAACRVMLKGVEP